MKLTTRKKLVIFKKINNGRYFCCNRNFFVETYKDNMVIPVMYTDNLDLAIKTARKLNKELRA